MAIITSLKDLAGEIGNVITLKYGGNVTWTVGETITGASSGATAYIDQINTESRTLYVIPTSDVFFSAMENITSPGQTTPTPILPCELTQFEKWEKSVKQFIENYTNKKFGETENIVEEITTEENDRFFMIPRESTINSITLGGKTLTANSDYYYTQKTGLIDFNKNLPVPATPKNLVINYTTGELVIPENVKQAADILIVELWKRRNQSTDMRGAQSLSFGGKSISFNTPVQDKELEGLLPLVSGLLKRSAKYVLL